MNNLYKLSEQELTDRIEQLKRDTGYKILTAKHRPRLIQTIEELENRLTHLKKLATKTKPDWASLL